MDSSGLSSWVESAQASLRDLEDSVGPHLQHFSDALSDFADRVDRWGTRFFNGEAGFPSFHPEPPPPPPTIYERITGFARAHKIITTTVGAVAVVSVYRVIAHRRALHQSKRRRAPRASNGNRTEAVLLVGAAGDIAGKSVALDLERRGFVLFCIVSNSHEQDMIEREGKPELHALNLDAQNPNAADQAIEKMCNTMNSAVPEMRLAGIVVVPDAGYATGPLETIPLDDWRDIFYVNVFGTINLIQAFLPLVRSHQSRLILITSTNLSSLNPPFHSTQTVSTQALSTLWLCLHRELCQLTPPISVTHLKTGTMEFSKSHMLSNNARANMLSWTPEMRAIYSKMYSSNAFSSSKAMYRGTPVRVLHNAVFDGLTLPANKISRVQHIGLGSSMYSIIGQWAPETVVGWMLGCWRGRQQRHPKPDNSMEDKWDMMPDVGDSITNPVHGFH